MEENKLDIGGTKIEAIGSSESDYHETAKASYIFKRLHIAYA